jgi:hypothetical protein
VNVIDEPDKGTVMSATAEIVNPYPVTLEVPGLGWKVLVPGCTPSEQIHATDADTSSIFIQAGKNITVDISSSISSLPEQLLNPCNDLTPSPLESLFQSFLDPNLTTKIFISGRHQSSPSLPSWLPSLLSSLTLPIPIPSLDPNSASDLISGIHIHEMKFRLPSPWAPPGTPYSQPTVSGVIETILRLPAEVADVAVNITALKADIDLFDQGQKFGKIVVPEWVSATTQRKKKTLRVVARVTEVPVEVLDPLVFNRVMRKVLQGGGVVEIGIQGVVDGQVKVLVGEFALRGIPVERTVEVEGTFPLPKVDMHLTGGVGLLETTRKGMQVRTSVQVENPTEYEAVIPYLNLRLLYEG